jgi:diamine N-acetyltransferase
MSALTYHLITEEEIPVLQALVEQIYFKNYDYLWADGGQWYVEAMYNTETIKKEIYEANSVYLFVNQEGTHIGFLKINLIKPFIIAEKVVDKNAMELQRIYLTKSGKGIGQSILSFVIELAKQHRKNTLFLQVMSSSEKAFRFYQRSGFEKCDETQLTFEKLKPQLRGLTTMVKYL